MTSLEDGDPYGHRAGRLPLGRELQNSDPAAVTSASSGTGNGTVTVSIPPNAGVTNLTYGVQIGSTSASISEQNPCTYSFPNGSTAVLPADAVRHIP